MDKIAELHDSINNIDKQIVRLLAERKDLDIALANEKYSLGLPVRDDELNKTNIQKLQDLGMTMNLSPDFIDSVFGKVYKNSESLKISHLLGIISTSHQLNRDLKVSFLGNVGTYSYLATYKYFNSLADYIRPKNCHSFDDIISAVESGECDCGVLPIENTSSGCINEVYDLLQKSRVTIIGELTYPIEHTILVSRDTDISRIKTLYAHPQPFSQCSDWIHTHLPDAELKACSSSSEAMETVKNLNRDDCAAIGCAEAGALYSLKSIHGNIANQKRNITRFIVIGMVGIIVPEDIEAKTSITFTTENTPGSLVRVLNVFSSKGINMVKLQSRPRIHNNLDDVSKGAWDETFYADIMVNANTEVMLNLLKELEQVTGSVRVLGCYAARSSYTR
jgi:chorismate mutase/prephenate dehydratase